MTTNTTVRLGARPIGEPRHSDWIIAQEAIPEIGPGQFLVRVDMISLDPAMRGWLDDRPSYLPPVGIGDVMRAGAVGEIIASEHPQFPVGMGVQGAFGVQEFAVSDGQGVTRVDPRLGTPSMYLGVLGITGLTAYFGLFDHGKPKAGDTLVVSAAAGAVGSVVGQIGKINGCRVIGIAGGAEKCAYVTNELGFDDVIDYKNDNLREAFARTCPTGIDIYFDNVGGKILNAALGNLALNARVVICGAISQYNAETPTPGPSNYLSVLIRRATMSGFIVFDYVNQYRTAQKRLAAWVAEGRITAPETIIGGSVTDFPDVLLKLFTGDNVGKLVLDISGSRR
jgi:NADPH-dependent curcumin reductase CurA